MSAKRWRLVVTELGGSTPAGEAVVDAPNWMAAFKTARGRIGEPETIPIGGSCTVSPDGRVNVLDPQRRRAYALIPLGDVPAHEAAPVAPQAAPQAAPQTSVQAEPPRKARPKTMAYIPDAMVPPVAPPTTSAPVSKKTMAYLPGQMGLPPVPAREIAIGGAEPPAAASPVAHAHGVAAPTSAPSSAQPAVSPAVPSMAPMRAEVRVAGERHVPASAESPVHYHELTIEIVSAHSPQALEAAVREHLDRVRSRIGGDPAVHFVRILAFAAARDSSEALAVCTWKGWTDEIAVQFPAAERAIQASLAASPGELYPAAAEDPRLADVVEAFEDIWFLASPAAGLEFAARVLEEHFTDVLVVTAVRESATSLDFHVASTRGGSSVAAVPDRLANDGLVALAAADPSRAVAVMDASRDSRARPSADVTGTGPLVAVAAAHGGSVLGLVRVSRAPGKPHFSAAEADLVRCVADRLAAFLRSRGTHLD